MCIPEHGKSLRDYLLMSMRHGGDMKYERDPEKRMALLRAVFDFNNCMAAMGTLNFIGQEEVTRAVAETNNHHRE